jgi:hypothetical protein
MRRLQEKLNQKEQAQIDLLREIESLREIVSRPSTLDKDTSRLLSKLEQANAQLFEKLRVSEESVESTRRELDKSRED